MNKRLTVSGMLLFFALWIGPSSVQADCLYQSVYRCVRLYPASPIVRHLLDEAGISQRDYNASSVDVQVTLNQMRYLYSRVNELVESGDAFISFMVVPCQETGAVNLDPTDDLGAGLEQERRAGLEGPAGATSPQVTALIVDDTFHSSIASKLDTFVADVTSWYPDVTMLTYHPSNLATPEDVRSLLQQLHETEGVNGAMLIGFLPYATWEMPWGEQAAAPLFYEDLDGVFLDQDSDGLYDYHEWGPNEGIEMWVSWVRPPREEAIEHLRRYFDKTHSYYTDDTPVEGGLLVAARDWHMGENAGMMPYFRDLYGYDVECLGCGSSCAYLHDYLSLYESKDYAIQNIWVHSSSSGHQFDWDEGQPPGWWLPAPELGALSRGPQFSVVWGCSAMNLNDDPDSTFSTWYIMGENNGLAALGVTRGIGTPQQETILGLIPRSDNLADAVLEYLNRIYDKDLVKAEDPDPNAFVHDVVLVGNPFIFHPMDGWEPSNLLGNPGFELGQSLPADWTQSSADMGQCIWSRDDTIAHSGDYSAKIACTEADDARWQQTLSVLPNRAYVLSGWVRTENVVRVEGDSGGGASLSREGSWNKTPSFHGTNGWTWTAAGFNSGEASEVTISARLGFWFATSTGTAWFDDLRLELVDLRYRVTPLAMQSTLEANETGTQPLTIDNVSKTELEWRLSESASVAWLSETPMSGTVSPGESITTSVAFDASGIGSGVYTTTLQVAVSGEPSLNVPINLTVHAANITVSPEALIAAVEKQGVTTQTLSIGNTGDSQLDWRLTETDAVPWLMESPISGTIPPDDRQNVIVTFDASATSLGTHQAGLRLASNDPVRQQIHVPVEISVYERAEADFNASPTRGTLPLSVDFTNLSTGDYSSSSWEFGDGLTSTLESPEHTYTTVGVYTVSLSVHGLGGVDTETKPAYVTVEPLRVYLPLVTRKE